LLPYVERSAPEDKFINQSAWEVRTKILRFNR
jgi:hypothetical protein